MADVWTMIAAERAAIYDRLNQLAEEDWGKPSLCAGWTVQDVVAHMTATAYTTQLGFFKKFILSGFNFNRMAAKDVAAQSASKTPQQILVAFGTRRQSRDHPPGPAMAMLGECVVHSEDIFRALGAYSEHPVDHLIATANFLEKNTLLIPGKKRIAGLSLRAEDTDWQGGTAGGPEVSGPLVALIMVMAGRTVALEDLEGPGLDQLRRQL